MSFPHSRSFGCAYCVARSRSCSPRLASGSTRRRHNKMVSSDASSRMGAAWVDVPAMDKFPTWRFYCIRQDISQHPIVDPHDTTDKRPKLERTRSAAEKENLPMQRAGSMLRRQYSQQEQPTNRRLSASDSGMDPVMSPGQQMQHHQQQQRARMQPMNPQQAQQGYGMQQQQQPRSGGAYPDDDPRYYQVSAPKINSLNHTDRGY